MEPMGVIATHHTHRTARRPKRTPTIGSAQFPNIDHTSRVVPVLGHSSEYNDFRSLVKPPFFYITMWKRVFSFTFRFALASIIETSIVSFGLDPFVLGTIDRTIRFGRRYSTYGWRLIRSSRIEVGSLA